MDRGEEIFHLLGKISARLDSIESSLENHFDDDKVQFADLRKKTGALEKKLSYAAGGVAVIVSVITITWNLIAAKLKGII